MNEIIETILNYFHAGNNNQDHRFRSWEHCYLYFQAKFAANNFDIIDLDCLQLGFYLASWGMYRGSSFLLKHSYRIHKNALQRIFQLNYNLLMQIDYQNNIDDNSMNLLLNLRNQIIEGYQEIIPQQNVSDTLVTKIILGTMGITPAYDRFFRVGCNHENIHPHAAFNANSFRNVHQFYLDNIDSFGVASQIIQNEANIIYPPMKLVDMYLWSIGVDNDFNQIE